MKYGVICIPSVLTVFMLRTFTMWGKRSAANFIVYIKHGWF